MLKQFLLTCCFFTCLVVMTMSASVAKESSRSFQTNYDDVSLSKEDGSGRHTRQEPSCHLSNRQLITLAESAAKATLQGVNNPREFDDRLHNFESQMADQMNILKTMILNIEDKLAQQETQNRKSSRALFHAISDVGEAMAGCSDVKSEKKDSFGATSDPSKLATMISDSTDGTGGVLSLTRKTDTLLLKKNNSGFEALADEDLPSPRQQEIDRFNSSIHIEKGKRVFSFYWKIGDIEYKLKSWGPRRSLRSPSFLIFENGYMMYMRIFPRQNGQHFYAHVGLTKGIYDEALEWPFFLKHRISILDQSSSPVQDITSRIWDPKVLCSGWNWRRPIDGDNQECVGLGFPSEDLRHQHFIYDDTILVKLTVYLD